MVRLAVDSLAFARIRGKRLPRGLAADAVQQCGQAALVGCICCRVGYVDGGSCREQGREDGNTANSSDLSG